MDKGKRERLEAAGYRIYDSAEEAFDAIFPWRTFDPATGKSDPEEIAAYNRERKVRDASKRMNEKYGEVFRKLAEDD